MKSNSRVITAACIVALASFTLVGCGLSQNTGTTQAPSASLGQSEAKDSMSHDSSSGFIAKWEGQPPQVFGNDKSKATLGNASIVRSSSGQYLLRIDFDYTNESEDARNFINDPYCNGDIFQDGIELSSPGITSETGVYDYGDAFTQIKNGATVSTQRAWVLRNTNSPLEVDFGRNENYKPAYVTTLVIEKA